MTPTQITEYEVVCHFCNGVQTDDLNPCLHCHGTGLLLTKKGMVLLEFVQRRLLGGIL